MSNRRHSPRKIKTKGGAVVCFLLCIAIIGAMAYFGYDFISSYDFTDAIPEDANLRAKFSRDGYIPVTPSPSPTPRPTPTPLPTPIPAPTCTPIPIELYSRQKMNFVMPKEATAPGEGEINYLNVSSGDGMQSVMLGGWAYIYGYDAEKSDIYLVVSSKSGSVNRFYETVKQPGFAGVVHTGSGQNLERADFRAAFSVKTYEEGPYKLGALVVQNPLAKRGERVYGYYEFGSEYQIYVKGNMVTQVG